MKLRVVGWTDYSNTRDIPEGEKTWSARNAIIDDIKKNGYLFSGECHQEGSNCAPILNDGKLYRYSQRGWGDIMAEAHGDCESMSYSLYAFGYRIKREQEIRPTIGYNRWEFTPETDLNEKFTVSADKSVFDSAEKDGRIKLDDLLELRYIDKGDTLKLICENEKAEYKIEDVDREKDIPEERLFKLRMAMRDLDDDERRQRAEDEFNSAKFVIIVKLKKSKRGIKA